MTYSIENLREDFKDFMKGEKSDLSVKSSAISLLEGAKNSGKTDIVNEIEDMRLMFDLGASGLITDYPDRALELRKGLVWDAGGERSLPIVGSEAG